MIAFIKENLLGLGQRLGFCPWAKTRFLPLGKDEVLPLGKDEVFALGQRRGFCPWAKTRFLPLGKDEVFARGQRRGICIKLHLWKNNHIVYKLKICNQFNFQVKPHLS